MYIYLLAQAAVSPAQLVVLSPTQSFILQLLGVLVPLFMVVAPAVAAWILSRLAKAQTTRIAIADKQSSDTVALAKSMDGVQSQLNVANRAAGFHEGAQLEAARTNDPASEARLIDRTKEVAQDVREAAAKSAAATEAAVVEIKNHLSEGVIK